MSLISAMHRNMSRFLWFNFIQFQQILSVHKVKMWGECNQIRFNSMSLGYIQHWQSQPTKWKGPLLWNSSRNARSRGCVWCGKPIKASHRDGAAHYLHQFYRPWTQLRAARFSRFWADSFLFTFIFYRSFPNFSSIIKYLSQHDPLTSCSISFVQVFSCHLKSCFYVIIWRLHSHFILWKCVCPTFGGEYV